MRHTLEQLKAMGKVELMSLWITGQFPFDNAPSCHNCITTHRGVGAKEDCTLPEHANLRADALRLGNYGDVERVFTSPGVLEELYALRLFYDHCYQQAAEIAQMAEVSHASVAK